MLFIQNMVRIMKQEVYEPYLSPEKHFLGQNIF